MTDRGLKIVLWIAAVGCGISILGVVVPWSWLAGCMAMYGLGAVPATPLFVYLMRTGCATYGLIGLYFLVLAGNPRAYAPFLKLSIGGLMFVGLVCLVTGLALNMRPPWYLGDVLFCWIIGLLLLVWYPKAQVPSESRSD